MAPRQRTEDANAERSRPDAYERRGGALCVSARGDVVPAWGLATIERPELVVCGCLPGSTVIDLLALHRLLPIRERHS